MVRSRPGPPVRRRPPSLVLAAALVAALPSRGHATGQDASGDARPREIPVPAIQTSLETLPGVADLPVRVEMPDVMTMSDGRPVPRLSRAVYS